MKNIFYFILVCIVFSKNFDGYILDEESGNPISNVDIILDSNQKLITKSNFDGQFIFNLEDTSDSILFNHIGYKNKKIVLSDLNKKVYLEKDILFF